MESINLTVREGDSFDELYLSFQKPIGLFYVAEGDGITSITSGTVIDANLSQYRIRVTTSGRHNLSSQDIIRIAGASVSGYNQTYTTNTLSIVSETVFEIVPGSGGTPNYSSTASGGTLNVLKEDTIALGTLQVKPRITSI